MGWLAVPQKIPRRWVPCVAEEACGSNAPLWVVCLKLSAIFIKEERSEERDLGVSSLNITPQILASVPRFLISVILIGFRSLEVTE